MARSQAQSDFAVSRATDVALPAAASPVELPRTGATEASELATRWILRLTFAVLAALALLCAIGPHIPAGE
jgi:hypothetical protein